MTSNKKNIIDLFCGCGGFSLGAHQAGFNSILAVDIDPILSSAYAKNFPNSKLLNLDLAKTSSKELLDACGNQEVFGVIGGPPCQGFSTMGRRDEGDPRNELIGHFFNHIKNIQPSFFVMENVPGLLSGKMREKLHVQLESISDKYTIVGPVVVTASKLGAPTKRQRILVIGYKAQTFEAFSEEDIMALHSQELVTVRDAIGDLPSPLKADDGSFGWAKYDGRKRVSEYARVARELPPSSWGWTTAVQKLDAGYVSGLMDTLHSPEVKDRYAVVEPGRTDQKSKAYKLDWNGQCPTLRAGTGSDKGSYQAVRPLHPEQGRVITVREAARLQGFPDWYTFHSTKWHSFRMIGNSVSPPLSREILTFISSRIKSSSRKKAA